MIVAERIKKRTQRAAWSKIDRVKPRKRGNATNFIATVERALPNSVIENKIYEELNEPLP